MDLIKEFLLESFPNADRTGCPDEETLLAFADKRLPTDHPARLHVFTCSECFAEYSGYCLELDMAKKAAGSLKTSHSEDKVFSTWGGVASNFSMRYITGTRIIKRFRQWISAYSHH